MATARPARLRTKQNIFMEKTTVFNLIILDESGSMSPLSRQTVDGCNETLNVIRSLQKKHGDTQRNLVSIFLFQDNEEIPSRYVCKNNPIEKTADLTPETYRPWGCTPLLDAVGSTLVDLRAVASTHEDATGIVTIITDGMENSSKEYSWQQVADMISKMKEEGWTFNFIGANIDVDAVSKKMNIDNALVFNASQAGTKEMWEDFSENLCAHEDARIQRECCMPVASREERVKLRKSMSMGFFKSKK